MNVKLLFLLVVVVVALVLGLSFGLTGEFRVAEAPENVDVEGTEGGEDHALRGTAEGRRGEAPRGGRGNEGRREHLLEEVPGGEGAGGEEGATGGRGEGENERADGEEGALDNLNEGVLVLVTEGQVTVVPEEGAGPAAAPVDDARPAGPGASADGTEGGHGGEQTEAGGSGPAAALAGPKVPAKPEKPGPSPNRVHYDLAHTLPKTTRLNLESGEFPSLPLQVSDDGQGQGGAVASSVPASTNGVQGVVQGNTSEVASDTASSGKQDNNLTKVYDDAKNLVKDAAVDVFNMILPPVQKPEATQTQDSQVNQS